MSEIVYQITGVISQKTYKQLLTLDLNDIGILLRLNRTHLPYFPYF
jgi:hypothetical protein